MRQTALAFALVSTLIFSGCATKRADTPSTTANPTAPATPATPAAVEPGPRIASPVSIPANSAKKIVMSMTGPKNVVEAKDWADLKKEFRSTFADHAKEAGIEFSVVEGDIPPQAADGTALVVTVADYRMVGIGARILFGIMTGNAYIDSKITFANLRDGAALGEQQHNTSSSAWGGIFAKVTPQQVDAIAAEVFRDFKAAKKL
jgi:hypothetical protein